MKNFLYMLSLLLTVEPLLTAEITQEEFKAITPFVILKEEVKEIESTYHLDIYQVLQKLVPIAQKLARPSISHYHVGVAGLGKSGNVYLGVNLEFAGLPLNQAVHAEQFLVTNARMHGEEELVAIALSAAPCGHCRQFLHEMDAEDKLLIITPNLTTPLSTLLPDPFGPNDLGLPANLMHQSKKTLFHEDSNSLFINAKQAALASYAPYSHSKSGVAIKTEDGMIFTGSYLENAAFNPSLAPLQTALIALVIGKKEYEEITDVILVEELSPTITHAGISDQIIRTIAPQANFEAIQLDLQR